jgi:DNA invertase Pin-like site-specific DNA recombinase
MCGVYAEFERGMIRERVNAELARARAKGVTLGRRPVKPSVESRIREVVAGHRTHCRTRGQDVPEAVVVRGGSSFLGPAPTLAHAPERGRRGI